MHGDTVAARLLPFLEPLQDRMQAWHCRVVPSTMEPASDALRAFPLSRDWQWKSLEEALQRIPVETLILQLPPFWQVEPLVHAAARAVGAALCIVEPGNYPLDMAAIRFASANAVVAGAVEAAAIAEYLIAHQVQLPPYWVVVHGVDAPSFDTPALLRKRDVRVIEEVHLAPGVPLLTRCEHIATAQSNLLHRSDVFAWGGTPSQPTISFKKPALVPLADFPLPFALEEKGVCACGKTLLERTYANAISVAKE